MRKREEIEERTIMVNAPVFGEKAADGRSWRPYRFERLEHVSRAQALFIRKLEWLFPSATSGQRVHASLLTRLKEAFEQEVQLAMDYVHVIRPKDLARYVIDPTFLAVLSAGPQKTRGFLEVELGLAHAAIDLLLGGEGEAVAPRPLTDIEDGVMSFVVLEALRALAPNIEPGLPRLRLEGVARGVDEAIQALAEEAHVVVVQLKLALGKHAGFLRLFLPASLVGMAAPLDEGPERSARRAAAAAQHMGRLAGVKTWLRAEIGRAEISSQELSELHDRDVVLADEITARPDKKEGGTARLRVGLGRFACVESEILVQDGRYAAKITRFVVGDAPRHAKAPSQNDEEAGESLADGQAAAKVDGPAAPGQYPDAENTNPSGVKELERSAVEESMQKQGADLLNDIPLQIAIELARIPVSADEVLSLRVGQVIDLSKVPGEPVEMSVNGKVVARGELVEVEGHLGVRILSLAG